MVYEIVSFRFTGSSTVTEQQQRLEVMGRWVRTQPGFVERMAFHDAEQGRWVDLVTWTDLASAQAAMARSQEEPEVAQAMATIDTTSLALGHYERRLVERR